MPAVLCQISRTAAAIIFVSCLFISGCFFMPRDERDVVITAGPNGFAVNGTPYRPAGTNLWYGAYLGSTRITGGRNRLLRELDSLAAMGINNLRVLACSEASYIPAALAPAFQTAPGVYDEELFAGLDFLLAQMHERGMRAVVILTNYWEWSGGMAVYNHWSGKPAVNPYAGNTWDEYMDYCASFYGNAAANALFRSTIEKIITRKNSFTGRLYSQDPVIMAWELANEPRPGSGPANTMYLEDYYRWITETAGFIRGLDSLHLITTGSEGITGSLKSEAVFLKAHASPDIDYCTFHLWPKNWNWYNPLEHGATWDTALATSLRYIERHAQLAASLHKPIVLEEFGFVRDGQSYSPASGVTHRDRFYESVLNAIARSDSSCPPIAGFNFWAWGGEGAAKHTDFMWKAGDPLTGDPPHEPQGFYSVFPSDTSTRALLQQACRTLRTYGGR